MIHIWRDHGTISPVPLWCAIDTKRGYLYTGRTLAHLAWDMLTHWRDPRRTCG